MQTLSPSLRQKDDYAIVHEPHGLARIRNPGIDVAVWQRKMPADLMAWLEEITARDSFSVETVCDGGAREWQHLTAALPEHELRHAMQRDIATLLGVFREVTGAGKLRASFGVVATDSCRKFHVDYVHLRLLCTYVGPGTEWVPERAVNRTALRKPWEDVEAINRAIVPDARSVRKARPGHVLLLKGVSYPGNASRGAIHRSAPIEDHDARRLVLVITELDRRG